MLDIQYLKISELTPYENNPRVNDTAVEAVANSIKEFGFKVPMIVDKNKVIIAGHTRFKACQELGITEVPCYIASDLTEDQIKAFRLADNKAGEIATWDFDKLEEELKNIEMDMSLFNFDMDFGFDEVEDDFNLDKEIEKIEEPITRSGQIWKLGEHYLMCGDATKAEDIEKLMKVGD